MESLSSKLTIFLEEESDPNGTAIAAFRKRFEFGKWKNLQDAPLEFGGRTIQQMPDMGFEISMGRYLKNKGKEIPLERGRASQENEKGNTTGSHWHERFVRQLSLGSP